MFFLLAVCPLMGFYDHNGTGTGTEIKLGLEPLVWSY